MSQILSYLIQNWKLENFRKFSPMPLICCIYLKVIWNGKKLAGKTEFLHSRKLNFSQTKAVS